MTDTTALATAAIAEANRRRSNPGFATRLVRRPVALASLVFLVVVIAVAFLAPVLLPGVSTNIAGDLLRVREAPSPDHLLGTDSLGRDVLELLLVGTRATLIGVFQAITVTSLIAIPVGICAGYFRGWFDRIVGWWIDIFMSIPSLILILVVVAIFPNSLLAAMITLGVISAPRQARILRAATLPIREELYIAAAKVSGLSRLHIVLRHVLPRVSGILVVQASLLAAAAVGITAGLSFLGVLDPSVPTWGASFQEGMKSLLLQPLLVLWPGLAIALTGLALTLLGDATRDTIAETWAPAPRRARSSRRERLLKSQAAAASLSGAPEFRDALVSVSRLTVEFTTASGSVTVLDDVTFDIHAGEVVGLVGESGCGKTMTAMAILGLLPAAGEVTAGAIHHRGRNLASLNERMFSKIRGREIALISQEPMVSLNPTLRVGWQIAELVRRHHKVSRAEAHRRTLELLERVRLPDPAGVARRYVHELSGGMAQRVAIARALAGDPDILIADEPTTALDVTVQAEILELLRSLQEERGMAILLVTHDWGVVADICNRAIVMYAGQVVEEAAVGDIFKSPGHPYTAALLASDPHRAPEARFLPTIRGSVPRPGQWPDGCRFSSRCELASDECRVRAIPLIEPRAGRLTRCIHHEQLVT